MKEKGKLIESPQLRISVEEAARQIWCIACGEGPEYQPQSEIDRAEIIIFAEIIGRAELKEAESTRKPSADLEEWLAKQYACYSGNTEFNLGYLACLGTLEVKLREVSQHPVPAPETQIQGDNAELVRMAEKLLEWMPIYSKGSSGNIRQTNLRAAIEKFKVEHPEPAPSRSVQRRIAAQKGEAAPIFEHPGPAKGGGE